MFANGFLLMLVTAVPFPTALVAMYLRTPAASTACAVYAGLFVVISIAYGLLLVAAPRRPRAGCSCPTPDQRFACACATVTPVGTPLYTLAALSAPLAPWLTLAICTGLWIFWSCAPGRRKWWPSR